MADQTRWNAVEHAPQHEAASRRDLDARLPIIGGPSLGEWLEHSALDLDTLAIASVAPPDHFINEAPVGGNPPMSVKSDRPMRPGGCSWRKITSRLGPLSARQRAIRRSKVRRTPGPSSECRRQISSKIATVRMPGAASSIGTIALSQTPASGSAEPSRASVPSPHDQSSTGFTTDSAESSFRYTQRWVEFVPGGLTSVAPHGMWRLRGSIDIVRDWTFTR